MPTLFLLCFLPSHSVILPTMQEMPADKSTDLLLHQRRVHFWCDVNKPNSFIFAAGKTREQDVIWCISHCSVTSVPKVQHLQTGAACLTSGFRFCIVGNKVWTMSLLPPWQLSFIVMMFLLSPCFQPNGKQSATLLGRWASNEAYYCVVHIMWCCPPSYPLCCFHC